MPIEPGSISTQRLNLSPLEIHDAAEMVGVLADPNLYEVIGGSPPSLPELESRYRSQIRGSGRPGEEWLNWIIRLRDSDTAVGYVQATILEGDAEMAWVVGSSWQRAGIASEAGRAVAVWLEEQGVAALSAHIQPDHLGSERVATNVGFVKTSEIDDEGEAVWRYRGVTP